MKEKTFQELKDYIGLAEADADNVRAIHDRAREVIPTVVDRFYAEILRHADARRILAGGEPQLTRLRGTLANWLSEVFEGQYGGDYLVKRLRIGDAHVRVGLPQHYMFTAMEIVWQELEKALRPTNGTAVSDAAMVSLHKILMLDLAIMLESYKDSHAEQVRRSERSAVEEKLTRAEHLAEIGQLAASLAHEIKNPLAGISGAIQVMRDATPADHPHGPILSEVLGQIGRLDATVKDLLLYARPTPPRATRFKLGDVVAGVLSVLREEPAIQRVTINFDGGPADATVHADDAQLEHLVMNLILNAAHASADGGTIHLRIARTGDVVQLVVQDGGCGMSAEVRDKAFEAFFTTKAKGTGLGLSICRKIVDAHGGHIRLSSELGHGTAVTVELPFDRHAKLSGVKS